MAGLANIVTIGPETGIALIFAGTCLQLHCNLICYTSLRIRTFIAFGACSVERGCALETFLSAVRATFVNHIGEHIVWAVINARGTLQEEPALTFEAIRD
jgi:hypothetical protein